MRYIKLFEEWVNENSSGYLSYFRFRSFPEARKFALTLGLDRKKDWMAFAKGPKRPYDIPSRPEIYYKNKGWTDWGDFLGTGNKSTKKREYRSFEEAREFAQSLNLSGEREWRDFCLSGDKPSDIPSRVDSYYAENGWTDWVDFLGTNNPRYKNVINFLPYEEAREFAQSLEFENREDWFNYCLSGELPDNIPANPRQHYLGKGWIDWGDFLGTYNVAPSNRIFKSYEEAQEYAKSLGIKDSKEWKAHNASGQRPSDIPSNPDEYYKDKGWISWSEFLGNDNISPSKRDILPFEEAREYVHTLGLRSKSQWEAYVKTGQLPKNIPTNAYQYYLNKGWVSWPDFLGKEQ